MTYDIAFLLKTIQVMANHIYHTSIFEAGQFCEKGAIYSKQFTQTGDMFVCTFL